MAAFANVREVRLYYYTHTHMHTYPILNASSWLTEKTTHTLAHAHTAQTESQSRLLIPITHTHTLGGAIWGAASVAACGINGNTSGNCSKLWRHTINLDRNTYRDRDRQQKERLRVRHISAAPDDFIHAFHAVDGKLSHNLSDTFLMLFIVWFMLLDLFHTVYSNNWVISTVGNRKEPVHKTTHPFSLLLYLFLSSVAPTVCFLSPSFF